MLFPNGREERGMTESLLIPLKRTREGGREGERERERENLVFLLLMSR